MANSKLRVGACSLASTPGDMEANLKKIEQWCSKATDKAVQLLLFPELSLSGYWLSHELFQRAQPRDCPAVRNLSSFL